MPRGKKNDGIGHNSGEPLTDDESAALLQYYALKIRAAKRKADDAKALYDLEREEVNALFSTARGDLKINRKEFEAVLSLQDMSEAEFRRHEEKRLSWMRFAGLPIGTQMDLFAEPDTVDDKIEAEANGYRAGLRGDDPTPPDFIHAVMVQDWMAGWTRGQAVQGERFIAAQAILEKRRAKTVAVGLTAETDSDEEGGLADPLDPDKISDEARKLRASGWTEPTEGESEFADTPPAEINLAKSPRARKPALSVV